MFLSKLKPLSFSLPIVMAMTLSACGGGGDEDTEITNNEDTSSELTAKELAFNKIKAYANGETSEAPKLSDYMSAGVSGVKNETLDELNIIVKNLSPEDVDSTAELDALTVPLGINIVPNANAGGNQIIEVNQSIKIAGIGSDADGEIVSYSWVKDNVVLAKTASFIYTPTVVGTELLTFSVTDNDGDITTDEMTIVVIAVTATDNKAPQSNAGLDLSTEVGKGINIVGSGTDADGTISAYQWSKGEAILANTSAFTYIPNEVGTDVLTLEVIDNDGAIASDTVKVVVSQATIVPNKIPEANAGDDKTVQVNKSIEISGSGMDSDGSIASLVWTKNSKVLSTTAKFSYVPDEVGIDILTLTVTDNDGDSSSDDMNVVVNKAPIIDDSINDATAPIISLLGSSSVNLEQGTVYNDLGATASDNIDGNITQDIIVSGQSVNTNAAVGSIFTIKYNVSDTAGNAATEITRTVKIVSLNDTIDPVISLSGPSTIEIIQGANYDESGATASDNRDGNITNNIVIAGETVNTNAAPGTTFTITYNVSDAAGNPAIEVTRSVSIIESPANNTIPVLSNATIQNYLTVINNARAVTRSCGVHGNFPAVASVSWSNKLYNAAYEHSQDMTEANFHAHEGSGTISDWTGYRIAAGTKSKFWQRIATYGYNYSTVSENIAAGTNRDTAQEVVDAWLASDGHCKNIMSSSVTEVGMALSSKSGTTYTHYWTQNFGKPQ